MLFRSPGVAPAETLEDLAKVHVDVGELSGEDVENKKVVVVLLVESEEVGYNPHHVMNEVSHVEEAIVLHEGNVPDEMTGCVHEHYELEVSYLLRAGEVVGKDVPVHAHGPGYDAVVDAD